MKKQRSNHRPRAGQVWVCRDKATRTPSRRIVCTGTTTAGTLSTLLVYYSTGSVGLHCCQWRAFRVWVCRYQAVATRTRRPRTLVLRAQVVR